MQRLRLEIGKCATPPGVLCFPAALFCVLDIWISLSSQIQSSSEFKCCLVTQFHSVSFCAPDKFPSHVNNSSQTFSVLIKV